VAGASRPHALRGPQRARSQRHRPRMTEEIAPRSNHFHNQRRHAPVWDCPCARDCAKPSSTTSRRVLPTSDPSRPPCGSTRCPHGRYSPRRAHHRSSSTPDAQIREYVAAAEMGGAGTTRREADESRALSTRSDSWWLDGVAQSRHHGHPNRCMGAFGVKMFETAAANLFGQPRGVADFEHGGASHACGSDARPRHCIDALKINCQHFRNSRRCRM